MIYSDYVASLSNLLTIQSSNTDFVQILPRCIEYAELRLYRELDLVANSTRITTYALVASNRNLTIPVGTFVGINNINVVTPAGTTNPELGTRVALTPMSWDLLDALYGSAATPTVPKFFALQDSATIAVGPWPDAAYQVEIVGSVRPAPLSASNTTTTLSLFFPDLLIAASMIFMAGYVRNFGQQADDPNMAQSWSSTYDKLLASAVTEEQRKKAISNPVS